MNEIRNAETIAGRISGNVIEPERAAAGRGPEVVGRLLQPDVDLLQPRDQHEQRVRQADDDVPDDDRQDRPRHTDCVKQQQQRDPEHDVRDDERAEQQRRHGRLPRKRRRTSAIDASVPKHDRPDAGDRGDDRTRLERTDQVGIVTNWRYQVSVNPLSGNDGSTESLNEKSSRIAIGA